MVPHALVIWRVKEDPTSDHAYVLALVSQDRLAMLTISYAFSQSPTGRESNGARDLKAALDHSSKPSGRCAYVGMDSLLLILPIYGSQLIDTMITVSHTILACLPLLIS